MRIIQFTLSLCLTLCVTIMLYGAITKPSLIQEMNISIMLLLLSGCLILNKIAYKEAFVSEPVNE